ncbi:hypothetical protein P8605_04695 [Streptomyces sp. T-3]|nr:hypothetical protein [Streptomyces sp. T-3]
MREGLCLFPGDGDVSSPDVCWAYSGSARFRRRLARAEGFALEEMAGFGGERSWSEVTTSLEPLLDHPDDHGELSPAECAAILPRLAAIHGQWIAAAADGDAVLAEHIDDLAALLTVLNVCNDKGVGLLFG